VRFATSTLRALRSERRATKRLGSVGSARERHGLFRCGAFGAARIGCPSIQIREWYCPQARIAGDLTFDPQLSRLKSKARPAERHPGVLWKPQRFVQLRIVKNVPEMIAQAKWELTSRIRDESNVSKRIPFLPAITAFHEAPAQRPTC
jgi:hypothetical protein